MCAESGNKVGGGRRVVGAVVLLAVFVVYPAYRILFGQLVKAGQVNLKTETVKLADEAAARATAARVDGRAFVDEVLAKAGREMPDRGFIASDLQVRCTAEGPSLYVNMSYKPWCRSRYDLRRWASVLEYGGPKAKRRNERLEAAFMAELADLTRAPATRSTSATAATAGSAYVMGPDGVRALQGWTPYPDFKRREQTELVPRTEEFKVPGVLAVVLAAMGLLYMLAPGLMRHVSWAWYGLWGWRPKLESVWQSRAFYRIGGAVVLGFLEWLIFAPHVPD